MLTVWLVLCEIYKRKNVSSLLFDLAKPKFDLFLGFEIENKISVICFKSLSLDFAAETFYHICQNFDSSTNKKKKVDVLDTSKTYVGRSIFFLFFCVCNYK